MKEKLTFYRPAAAAFLVIMAMALTSSTISFFLEPVCEDLQISRGSFSMIFSLMSISGALSNPFVGQYAGKKGVRGILLLTGLWAGSCMFLLSLVTRLWMLYALAFCLGLFGASCLTLCGNVIVQQNYFEAQASGILGAVMAGTGVGGMFFSLIIPRVIAVFDWRMGMTVMGICWLTLLWLGALLLGKQNRLQEGKSSGAVGLGMTRAEALKSPKLYLQMVVIVIMSACCGLQQQLPSLLGARGFTAGQVSVMISAMTVFLAIGKFGQGLLYGKIGVEKGGLLTMAAFAAGCLAMFSKALAWPDSAGCGYGHLYHIASRGDPPGLRFPGICLHLGAGFHSRLCRNHRGISPLGYHLRSDGNLHPWPDWWSSAAGLCHGSPLENLTEY